jgi:GT2 family glycosyltransferase
VTAAKPIVSALIVNYHAYDELAACLGSLDQQTLKALEVIVVDHDSNPIQCDPLARRFPNTRFVATSENPGFAAGVNRGARLARGDYLFLLNPDAVADANVSETLARFLDDHPAIGAVGSLVRNADGSIQGSARRFPDATTVFGGRTSVLTRLFPQNPITRRNILTGSAVTSPKIVDWVAGASMMIRRHAFEQVHGMDEGFFLYWEDADFCYRLKKEGWQTVYDPRSGVTHLTGRSSRSSTASIVAFHQSVFRYFVKHGSPAARLATPLVVLALGVRLCAKVVFNAARRT